MQTVLLFLSGTRPPFHLQGTEKRNAQIYAYANLLAVLDLKYG